MIKGVLFDVDGVLLDSLDTNLYFFQKFLEVFGYKPPTKEEYKKVHHVGMFEAIRALTYLEDEEEIYKIWMFAKTFDDGGPPAKMPDGASEVLRLLSEKYKLGIVTSRVQNTVFEGLEFLKLKNLFKIVVAYEDTEKHKPDPEPVLLAIQKLKLLPEECVYIGDAETDMQAGKAAGTKTIFYTPGLFPKLPGLIEKF
jgi:pyrophosphatase PpaX